MSKLRLFAQTLCARSAQIRCSSTKARETKRNRKRSLIALTQTQIVCVFASHLFRFFAPTRHFELSKQTNKAAAAAAAFSLLQQHADHTRTQFNAVVCGRVESNNNNYYSLFFSLSLSFSLAFLLFALVVNPAKTIWSREWWMFYYKFVSVCRLCQWSASWRKQAKQNKKLNSLLKLYLLLSTSIELTMSSSQRSLVCLLVGCWVAATCLFVCSRLCVQKHSQLLAPLFFRSLAHYSSSAAHCWLCTLAVCVSSITQLASERIRRPTKMIACERARDDTNTHTMRVGWVKVRALKQRTEHREQSNQSAGKAWGAE